MDDLINYNHSIEERMQYFNQRYGISHPENNKLQVRLKKEKELLWQNFLDYVKQRCINSTIIGLSNFVRTDFMIIKIMWLVACLGSVGFCLWQIVNMITTFVAYDVIVSLNYEIDTSTNMPAVSICNLNPFDQSHAANYIHDLLNQNNLGNSYDVNNVTESPQTINYFIKANIAGDNTMNASQKQYLGVSMDFLLLKCSFLGVPCNLTTDWVYDYDFYYLNCYTWNSGYDQDGNSVPIKQVSQSGSDQSLRLELFVGSDDYNRTLFTLNSGARVIIYNQSYEPIRTSEGLDLTTGYLTNIGLERHFLNKLDSPYSDCIMNSDSPDSFSSDLYKSVFLSLNHSQYRQKVCIKLCLQEYIRAECDCLDGSLPNIYPETVGVCMSLGNISCISIARNQFFADESATEQCLNRCPLECKTIGYEYTISNSRYPTSYYVDYLKYNTKVSAKLKETGSDDSNIPKTTLAVNIFYKTLDYEVIDEVPALTMDDLFNNIAGNLGLFIGVSILSGVELIELALQMGLYMFYYVSFFRKRDV